MPGASDNFVFLIFIMKEEKLKTLKFEMKFLAACLCFWSGILFAGPAGAADVDGEDLAGFSIGYTSECIADLAEQFGN